MVRKKFGGLPTAPGLPARFFAGVYDKIGRVMLIPFGRPFLALMFCSLAGGGVMLLRSPWQRADLSVWVSVESHARIYQQIGGTRATVDLIAPAALEVRLLSLFMFDKPTNSSPDLVEVDLGSAGKVFRPPLEEIGFLPLNDYLARSGWMSKILSSRFSPWSKDGIIFGVPNDLHPCTLTYRKDLFDQAGVKLASSQSWIDLQENCLRFQKYWHDHGKPRIAMGLSSTTPDMLLLMLRQQHVQLLDADLVVHLTDEKVVRTLCWYAQAVAGARQFAGDLNPAPGQNARDLAAGDICLLFTPDWMVSDLKQFAPEMAGSVAMIPLPRFGGGDARTASWGGTMIGITRTCSHPDLAWKMIESFYLDRNAREKSTGIIPPIPQYWTDPAYHQPDPFFAGQKIDELYIQLAREMPTMIMTPYTTTAQTFLAIALNRTVARVRSDGDLDLESFCRND